MPAKEVAGRLYVHVCSLSGLSPPHQELVRAAADIANLQRERDFNLVKIDQRGGTISLLWYPDFFNAGFPSLRRSWIVAPSTGRVSRRTYEDSVNPPILHRKELLLPLDHPDRPRFAALTKDAEALGLFDIPSSIGFREVWEQLVAARGYCVEGNALVPLANAEGIDLESDFVPGETGAISRHRTALSRYSFSAPVQALLRHELVGPERPLFDYGCGRGDDVSGLRALGIAANGWDPHYAPEEERRPADAVNLGFVINVIEDFGERVEALQNAYALAQKVLSVSVMLSNGAAPAGRPYRDGFITSRNTFQKYFSQTELATFLAHVLDEEPIPVSPGVLFVFRDKSLEQSFLSGRQRSTGLVYRLGRIEKQEIAIKRPERRDRDDEKYQANQIELDQLWQTWLTLGREPEDDELPSTEALVASFGSTRRALRFLGSRKDPALLERARNARKDDLLVYLALQQFRGVQPYKQLEARLQRDIKAFFGGYPPAQAEATKLLLTARDPEYLHAACVEAAEQGLGWLEEDRSLQLQSELVERLPALLRVYAGCASVLYGDVQNADLIKIHIRSGKLTLMRFDDFLGHPLPRMIERVKVKLRAQEVDLFQYGQDYEPPYLYFKSRYLSEESPRYAAQVAFEAQLAEVGLLDFSGYGPSANEFDKRLAARRLTIDDYRLVRSRTIPELDAPCGERLTFRQLIECGETQRQTGLPNLPREADTYNALFDLAANILDPVIEYFGPIELTYGFASPELTKKIKGRIDPKLDQHASHERTRTGAHVCARLGAAVDFLVRDEDMLEVAEWIAANLPFDRIYYYAPERPIHVSYGPECRREFVEMVLAANGKRIPKVRRAAGR